MAEVVSPPQISVNDRLSFTLFLAICIHMMVILGVGFVKPEVAQVEHKVLSVMLATNQSLIAPEKADFIGQADQLGAGEKLVKNEQSSPANGPFPTQEIQEVVPLQQSAPSILNEKKELLSSTVSDKYFLQQKQTPKQELHENQLQTDSLSLRSQAIASLQAELREASLAESNRKRRRQVSAAIHQASDAMYLSTWQRKIERVGNINYPAQARIQKIYGTLKMKIAIQGDGSLEKVQILTSSGFKILDDAALRIVHLASPFAPLPPEIRKNTDVLEIIRVWQFLPGNRLSTQ